MAKRKSYKLDVFGQTIKSFTSEEALKQAYDNLRPNDRRGARMYHKGATPPNNRPIRP